MSLVLTPLFSDALTTTANPLNPTNWTTATGATNLKVTGGNCEGTSVGGFNAEYWSNGVFPNDQYGSIKITGAIPLGSGSTLLVGARCNADASQGFFLEAFDNASTAGHLDLVIADAASNTLFDSPSLPYSVGDVFTIAVVGTTVYAIQNGVVIGSVVSSLYSSGFVMLGTIPFSALTDVKANSFVAGSAAVAALAYSVPDCRNSYCGLVQTTHVYPNGNRTVQGTVIYDVETSNNAAIPPTDSRTAGAPVDSRTASNKPQNSRTPGTFGPGE